jgi:hypothetical protein
MMKRTLVSGAALVLVALSCFAQKSSEIRVRVTDLSGATLSSAHVLIRANAPNTRVTDVAAKEIQKPGEYSVKVKPGAYDIFVSAPCAEPFVTQVEVADTRPEVLRVQMKPQYDVRAASRSGCPTPDDFSTPIDFNMYSPQLPDHVPPPPSGDAGSQTMKP